MNEERVDFAAKLSLIEEQARICAAQLPPGVIRSRLENTVTTARLLRYRPDVASVLVLPDKKAENP